MKRDDIKRLSAYEIRYKLIRERKIKKLNEKEINVATSLVIDPITREIYPKCRSQKDVFVAKGDHNSSYVLFEIPRYIDGHDMSSETTIRIHYANVGEAEGKISRGFSEAKDITIEETEDTLFFGWLIPNTATRYAGFTSVGVTFECYDSVEGETEECYSWSASPYDSIRVCDSIDNTEEVIEREKDYLVETCNAIIKNALEEAKNSGEFDGPQGDKGDKGEKGDSAPIDNTANSIKSKRTGKAPLTIDDPSDLEHTVKVKASPDVKNFIPYPYTDFNGYIGGIESTVDEDGSFRINGMGDVAYQNVTTTTIITTFTLKAGTYTLCGDYKYPVQSISLGTTDGIIAKSTENPTFTLEKETTVNLSVDALYVDANEKINSIVRPMLVEGDASREWLPYGPLTVYGQNLLDLTSVNGHYGSVILPDNSIRADVVDFYYAQITLTSLNALIQSLDGQDLTFSVKEKHPDCYMSLVVSYTDGTNIDANGGNPITLHLDHKGRTVNCIYLRPMRQDKAFTDTETIIEELQLVIGKEAKPYVPASIIQRYEMSQGILEYDVVSRYPLTTVLVQGTNEKIEVEYNKDTESAIKDYAYSKEESDEKFLTGTGLGNVFAGALRGSALGTTAVTLKDVSEVEHDVQVSVATRQISICPYNNVGNTHYTDFGIDISIDRETGVLTFNGVGEGVPEDWSGMVSQLINLHKITLPAGEYEIYSGGDYRLQGCVWIGDSPTFDGTFELTEEQEIDVMLRVDITNGESFNNVTAKVFLCKVGDTPIVPLDEINVCAYGGNLLYLENAYPDNTMIGVENYNQVSQQYSKLLIPLLIALNGKTLVFSRSNHANSGMQVYIKYTNNASDTYYNNSGEDFVKFTLNIPEGESISVLYFRYAYGSVKTESDKIGKNLKLELGDTPTPYTPPLKQIKVYKAGKDGTVEGVTSIYPSMTLVSDVKGVEINARYNKDVNRVAADFESRLKALELRV